MNPTTTSYTQTFYRRYGKRLFDVFVSATALVLLAPVLLATALVVRLFLGSPVLFRQVRCGRGKRNFTILKFRSMTDRRDADGNLLPDADRLTRLGRFLRSSSLDELPELLNVLRGEMSLVGPRPLFDRYLGRYDAEQIRRHDVLPGITGLAQVRGRNHLSWEQKFALDVWYVDHLSFWLDVKIMLLTVGVLFSRQGIDEPGRVGTVEFMGSAARAASGAGPVREVLPGGPAAPGCVS